MTTLELFLIRLAYAGAAYLAVRIAQGVLSS